MPRASWARCDWWRGKAKVKLDDATDVTVEVGFGKDSEGGFGLTGKIVGYLPGLEQSAADDLVARPTRCARTPRPPGATSTSTSRPRSSHPHRPQQAGAVLRSNPAA